MKRTRQGWETGSLDMLLDAMCNTFGGVCFIALMVALISSTLPRENANDDAGNEDLPSMLIDKEREALTRTRDELRAAIELQREMIASNASPDTFVSAADGLAAIASNAQEVARLKVKREALEADLAKSKSHTEYNRREAARLERVLHDMQEQLDKPLDLKRRQVRTPLERELAGLRSVDMWLRHGMLYLIDWDGSPPSQVSIRESHVDGKLKWTVSIIPQTGFQVDRDFFHGDDWADIRRRLDSRCYARIFCDEESFPQLCELRDALIYFMKMYNWHICNEDTQHFVQGYDGHVQ